MSYYLQTVKNFGWNSLQNIKIELKFSQLNRLEQ